MRTYGIGNRSGVSSGRKMFSNAKTEEKKTKFDFIEFLASDEKIVAPESFATFISSMKRRDGSYADNDDYDTPRPIDFYSTCWALCAIKTIGLEVEEETVEYIGRRKNAGNGSFGSGFDSGEGNIECTYWATLALRLCGKPVSPESVEYIKSFRQEDGSYGSLGYTYMALAVLGAAGCGLSREEKSKTMGYVASAFWESDKDITDCYDAAVSMNMLAAELGQGMKETVMDLIEDVEPDSENENFKLSAIKQCTGNYHAGTQTHPARGAPESMSELCHALWTRKLEAYA